MPWAPLRRHRPGSTRQPDDGADRVALPVAVGEVRHADPGPSTAACTTLTPSHRSRAAMRCSCRRPPIPGSRVQLSSRAAPPDGGAVGFAPTRTGVYWRPGCQTGNADGRWGRRRKRTAAGAGSRWCSGSCRPACGRSPSLSPLGPLPRTCDLVALPAKICASSLVHPLGRLEWSVVTRCRGVLTAPFSPPACGPTACDRARQELATRRVRQMRVDPGSPTDPPPGIHCPSGVECGRLSGRQAGCRGPPVRTGRIRLLHRSCHSGRVNHTVTALARLMFLSEVVLGVRGVGVVVCRRARSDPQEPRPRARTTTATNRRSACRFSRRSPAVLPTGGLVQLIGSERSRLGSTYQVHCERQAALRPMSDTVLGAVGEKLTAD